MQLQDAIRDAPSFLRNAQETAQRSPVNPETLYMWDNQVTAIETFLAGTEDIANGNSALTQQRKELYELKRAIQNKVLEFELKQEGQEMPPEPSEEELLAEMLEMSKDIDKLCKDVEKAPLKTVKDIDQMEEPREMLNAFLVDTEPMMGKNKALDQVRAKAKATRQALEDKIQDLIRQWRLSDVDDGEDEG